MAMDNPLIEVVALAAHHRLEHSKYIFLYYFQNLAKTVI